LASKVAIWPAMGRAVELVIGLAIVASATEQAGEERTA
jgi:hypothetical protein